GAGRWCARPLQARVAEDQHFGPVPEAVLAGPRIAQPDVRLVERRLEPAMGNRMPPRLLPRELAVAVGPEQLVRRQRRLVGQAGALAVEQGLLEPASGEVGTVDLHADQR